MKIKNRKIKDLIRAEYNPRELTQDQENQLKDSLQRFGIVDPVIVNVHPERKDIIIGGHQRTKVWESLGNDTIPTVELDLTPDQERELNIRLNKNTGQFDMDLLTQFFETEELVDWGFAGWEVEVQSDIDYSALDDETEELDHDVEDMVDGVRKAIQIEFDLEHYDEANELVHFWREREGDVGMMLIEKLKSEREKISE